MKQQGILGREGIQLFLYCAEWHVLEEMASMAVSEHACYPVARSRSDL